MRQFVHRGPEIPSEVLYALEEERLVFFCGAGISVYTGLPDFKQLTVDAFAACNVPLAADTQDLREPWDHAFHEEKYDKALGLLEQEATPGTMRRNVVARLFRPLPPQLSDGPHIHRALLDLSQHRDGGHLLITTNFDDRFALAGLPDSRSHAAPRLAPPRRGEWRHLTYLHGQIDRDEDPNGCGLVLTSADFGKAYLRDGWAARFVVELFREFTVLFVGYGLNDPAMAYLIDALAADMGPRKQFKRAFALASYRDDGNDLDRQRKLWGAKNVEFVPVNTGSDPAKPDFSLLNETLLEWARRHRGGLDSRIADALTNTNQLFVPGNDDQEVKKVAWALSEADGIVARKFAEADPPPHITWLKPLSEVDIRQRDSDKVFRLFHHPAGPPRNDGDLAGKGRAPLVGWHAVPEYGLPLAPVPFQLARWLVRHLDKRELVEWIVEQAGHIHPLHPQFAPLIETELCKDKGLPSCFRLFWELVLRRTFSSKREFWNLMTWEVIDRLKEARADDITPIERQWMLAAGRPFLSAARRLSVHDEDNRLKLRNLVRIELELADDHAVQEVIRAVGTSESAARVAISLADDFTSILLQAVGLGQVAELSETLDHSYWALPSISDHDENKYAPGWTLLVLLCRTAFHAAVKRDELAAHALVHRWITRWSVNGYSIFRRLALYAYAVWPALATGDALRLLLDGGLDTLWSVDCRREVLQLLRRRGREFLKGELDRLVAAILEGLPASYFPSQTDQVFMERVRRREIAVRLGKLVQAQALLEGDAKSIGEDYLQRLSEETLRTERDEFLVWSGGMRQIAPATAELSAADVADEIMEIEEAWKAGTTFQDYVREKKEQSIAVMDFFAEKGERRHEVWSFGIRGFLPVEEITDFRNVGNYLLSLVEKHPDLVPPTMGGIVDWLQDSDEVVPADDPDEALFFQLWQMTWTASLQDGESSIVGDTRPVDAAINAPGGKLTEALLDRLWKRKPAEGSGLPDNLRHFFETVGAGTSASNRYARVILASRLVWLHAVDAEWSRDRIIARMRIGQDPEAPALWAGYLWSPRYSLSLLHDLKPALLEAIARAADIDEAHRRSLFELFAEIAVANGSVFAESELANAFASLTAEGLAKCASRFERNLEAAGGKAAALWQGTIGPIFAKYWPKTRQAVTPATSGSLARMLLATREAFPEALGTVDRHKLLGQTDASLVIHRLTQPAAEQATASDVPDGDAKAPAFYDLVRNHPEDVLRLLRITVDLEGERWQLRDLDKLLSRIAAARPEAIQVDDFRYLSNLSARG